MKYIKIITGILSLISLSVYLYAKYNSIINELSILRNNEKAFIFENYNIKNESRVFKLTIDQLEYFNDSLLRELDNVRKELKIKDNKLKQLQYIKSTVSKVDTVIYTDTIFSNSIVELDTVIQDRWYKNELKLKYPNTIIVKPSFISEKFIIINYKKETIKPPKKFFLLRWFQKKHKIIEVNVVERNPYIENDKLKFIEIIK